MSFDRWGMSGAIAALRDPAEDGMNIMHRLCDRPDWIAPTRQTYQRLERGAEWADGAPVAIDRRTALACAAIAAGQAEWSRKVDTPATR